ncbi:T9SS type A sorting domain-containing protein [Dysgonomonas sp. HDW5B]|uniref:T9SS type A sorting domain-containing protein n=1 Tax=Dysgonomonas sp. HDW5B TaxID=2714927 RepID=UPI001408E377|nr:T9SS type A sorting domain-containing protein [Dysgonomonas sp. HDW5B]QIK55980.1 T9SS type A sorting domain-containing protein [Dysgonomonas sp. HDW5B]
MINKQLLFLLVSSILSLSAFGQISQGGVPPSFSRPNTLRSASPVTNIPVNLDVDRLIWEDAIVERNGGPMRVAEVLPVDVDIHKTGNWSTFSDSVKIWQETIFAQGAKGLILSYKDFYIPEGAKLFIYNEDHSEILGAYTRSTHPEGGSFATEIISGEKITLEYVSSATSSEQPRLVVEDVGYIYNPRAVPGYKPTINLSAPCMINVNCSQGANWQTQKRGVVLLIIKFNLRWSACSGSLINNTRRDGTPYILTANHCFVLDGVIDQSQMIAYFNYEFPGCQNETVFPETAKTLVGADILVNAPIEETTGSTTIRGSDGALIKLRDNVPVEWKPFYNGWDRRNIAATSGVVIHHPYFDVKKIITYNRSLTSATYDDRIYDKDGNVIGGSLGANNASWKVQYDGSSVTQLGSSGSPIFSQEGLILGALTGGETRCDLLYGYDFYGKFSYHWDYLEGENRQIKKYLDPINEGNKTLKGYDPNYPSGLEPEIVDNSTKDIVIFPTMADNEINVNTSSIIRSIKIYDLAGRQIYTKSGYNASTATIPVDGWQKGVYSVVIQADFGKLTEKFIKK